MHPNPTSGHRVCSGSFRCSFGCRALIFVALCGRVPGLFWACVWFLWFSVFLRLLLGASYLFELKGFSALVVWLLNSLFWDDSTSVCLSSLIFMLFVHPTESFWFWESSMSYCLWSIFRLFVHPLSSFSFSPGSSGAPNVRLWEFVFYLFSCIQWILFASWFFVSSFYPFLILRLFVQPLDFFLFLSLVVGRRFYSK